MKKFTAIAALLIAAGSAQAQLVFDNDRGTGIRNQLFNPAPDVGLTFTAPTIALGTLDALRPGTITFTYLGQESGYYDGLTLQISPFTSLLETDLVGKSITATIGKGDVDFKFFDSKGGVAENGGFWSVSNSIGLIASDFSVTKKPKGSLVTIGQKFDFVLGYNDSGRNHDDWDDFVVGVNYVAAPIPEPETYALMLAGLGMMGFIARRRRAG